jgi:tRNA threonylcarbamoyl adenosine modification protein (Sua5/YciO/YrdC/YwlC family)
MKCSVPEQIDIIINCLRAGGVICFDTETVCALACDAMNQDAIDKIYKIKVRDKEKPLSILLPSIEAAKKYVVINDKAASLIKEFSPGPITYILPNKSLLNWPNSIGVRIPNHTAALLILNNYPNPLVGTSVNISGEESAKTIKDIPDNIRNLVDIIVTNTINHASFLPSTIVDLCSSEEVKIIREGSVTKEEICKIYNR